MSPVAYCPTAHTSLDDAPATEYSVVEGLPIVNAVHARPFQCSASPRIEADPTAHTSSGPRALTPSNSSLPGGLADPRIFHVAFEVLAEELGAGSPPGAASPHVDEALAVGTTSAPGEEAVAASVVGAA